MSIPKNLHKMIASLAFSNIAFCYQYTWPIDTEEKDMDVDEKLDYYSRSNVHPLCNNLVEQYVKCLTREKEYHANMNKFQKLMRYGSTDYIPKVGLITKFGPVIQCNNIREMLLKCDKEMKQIEQIEQNKK